jgi:hypothetical protein
MRRRDTEEGVGALSGAAERRWKRVLAAASFTDVCSLLRALLVCIVRFLLSYSARQLATDKEVQCSALLHAAASDERERKLVSSAFYSMGFEYQSAIQAGTAVGRNAATTVAGKVSTMRDEEAEEASMLNNEERCFCVEETSHADE